jgi:hypothetical protein
LAKKLFVKTCKFSLRRKKGLAFCLAKRARRCFCQNFESKKNAVLAVHIHNPIPRALSRNFRPFNMRAAFVLAAIGLAMTSGAQV